MGEFGRHNNSAVLLPDGTVLTVGGQSRPQNHINQQREALLYTPTTDSWTNMANQREARDYHSTALLLPDGRVVSAGDDAFHDPPPDDGIPPLSPGGADTDNIELYSPPYLFNDAGGTAARPAITSAPTSVTWGQGFQIGTAIPTEVDKVVLIAPGAVTHANDMHQRLVEIEITSRTSSLLNVKAPASEHIAPPGYYMLFLLNKTQTGQARRVPSVARWVRIGPNSMQFNAAAYFVAEGTAPTITVTRTGTRTDQIEVDYATSSGITAGEAQAGVDYTATSGTLMFAAGSSVAQTFTISIAEDMVPEGNERVSLTLTNPRVTSPPTAPTPIAGAPNPVFLTIVRNDGF